MRSAASVNRAARKTKTEEYPREFLTTTKVVPQSKLQKASDRSARKRFVMLSRYLNKMGGKSRKFVDLGR